MRKLILSKKENDELCKSGSVYIERNGFEILVELNGSDVFKKLEVGRSIGYSITIINPYDEVDFKDK